MLRLTRIVIDNYKSIGHLEYPIQPGVYRAVADVIDGEYKSNGGGKSTALQAVFLGLYNLDFQGAPIDSLSNRHTKKLFRIEIEFEVSHDDQVTQYKIINDRSTKRHYLYRNGVKISSAYKETAKHVMEIFGMSAQTFKFTHYITTNTILELTQNLTNITMFNEILQVTQLKYIQKNVQQLKRDLIKKAADLNASLNIAKQQRQLEELLEGTSIDAIVQRLEQIEQQLQQIEQQQEIMVSPLQESLKELQHTLVEQEKAISDKKQVLKEGRCPTCGTIMINEDEYEIMELDVRGLQEQVKDIQTQRKELLEQITAIREKLASEALPLKAAKADLTKKRDAYQTLTSALEHIHTYEVSSSIIEEHAELNKAINFFNEVDQAIKRGEVFEEIMRDFFTIVNVNIQKYRKLINFSQFEVEAIPEKSGMRVRLSTQGIPVVIESLSNGERARLSLLILAALLESMHEVSGTHTNFIVFDEATSSFDEAGLADLHRLFKHLVSIGQSCFVISHGSELSSVEFTGELRLTKMDNVTTGTLTEI